MPDRRGLTIRLRARVLEQVRRRRASAIARELRDGHLTYLTWARLRTLERAVKRANRVPGDFIECGVALGGSAVLIGRRMPPGRRLHLYDTFGMIPPTGERDDEASHRRYREIRSGRSVGISGEPYYGYIENLEGKVRATLRDFGVQAELHKGLFEDTLALETPIAFAHLDCDWYASVRVCLERILPVLSPGGLLVVDDYSDWGGARAATDECLAEHPDLQVRDGGQESVVLGWRTQTTPRLAKARARPQRAPS
jgi:O-methyltransferase